MRGQWRLFLGEQEGYQGIYFRVGEEDGLHGGFHKFAVVIGFYAIIGGSHVVGAGFNDGLTDVLLGSVAGDAVGGPGAHVSLVGAEDALAVPSMVWQARQPPPPVNSARPAEIRSSDGPSLGWVVPGVGDALVGATVGGAVGGAVRAGTVGPDIGAAGAGDPPQATPKSAKNTTPQRSVDITVARAGVITLNLAHSHRGTGFAAAGVHH